MVFVKHPVTQQNLQEYIFITVYCGRYMGTKIAMLYMVCSIPSILLLAIFLNTIFGQTTQEWLVSLITIMAVVIVVLALTPIVFKTLQKRRKNKLSKNHNKFNI